MGLVIAGAGHREPWETDCSSTATSRVTHVAQCVVFGAVASDAAMLDAAMLDAAMLDAVLELDVTMCGVRRGLKVGVGAECWA
jgi:hypothetical protein